jgi:predicted peptidase
MSIRSNEGTAMSRRVLTVGMAAAVALAYPALTSFTGSGNSLAAPAQDYGLLPGKPDSDERWAPINALKRQAPQLAKAFAPHVYVSQSGERMPYRLFTPARLEPGRSYPLIVFLHGAGGSGTDNVKQLEGGNVYGALVWTLPENQARHPTFVLAPQSDWNWACTVFDPKNPPKVAADIKLCPPGALGIGARLAFEVIDGLLRSLPVDRARIYVTGHSMGGAGTWHMIAQRPRFFAAAVPVCGRGHPETAPLIKDVPIWNFHGATDEVEPVASSRQMIAALRKAGGRPRGTEYPDLGHTVFAWAYTEPVLVEWLFAQKRQPGPTGPRL